MEVARKSGTVKKLPMMRWNRADCDRITKSPKRAHVESVQADVSRSSRVGQRPSHERVRPDSVQFAAGPLVARRLRRIEFLQTVTGLPATASRSYQFSVTAARFAYPFAED